MTSPPPNEESRLPENHLDLNLEMAQIDADLAANVLRWGIDPEAFAKRVELKQRQIDIIKRGGSRPTTVASDPLESAGELDVFDVSRSDGFRLLMLSDEIYRISVERALLIKSETELEASIGQLEAWHNVWLDVLARHLADRPEFVGQAYERLLRHKGLLRRMVTTFGRPGGSENARLWEELVKVRQEIKQTWLQAGQPDVEALRHLRDQQADLERRLQRDTANLAAEETFNPTIKDVLAALPMGSALVDYVFYHSFEEILPGDPDRVPGGPSRRFSKNAQLLAFVLDARAATVRLHDLGAAQVIADKIRGWQGTNYNTLPSGSPERGIPAAVKARCEMRAQFERELASLVWNPLWTDSKVPARVVVSPDGELNYLSFITLRDSQNCPLVEQDVVISYLTSARELVVTASRSANSPAGPALAVGVSQFGGLQEALPNVARETESLTALWKKSAVVTQPPLIEEQATVTSLRESLTDNPSPRFLHIGSHGFVGPLKTLRHRQARAFAVGSPLENQAAPTKPRWQLSATIGWFGALLGTVSFAAGIVTWQYKQWCRAFYLIGAASLAVAFLATALRQPPPVESPVMATSQQSNLNRELQPTEDRLKEAAEFSTDVDPLLPQEVALVMLHAGQNSDRNPTGQGFLFSDDVAQLPLKGTEIVTLSSCETATGRVILSQGMRGLREAFLISGARNFVSAIADVADDDAREIIQRFYENVLQPENSNRTSPAESLQRAIKAHRESRRSKSEPASNDDSSRWGLFVLESTQI